MEIASQIEIYPRPVTVSRETGPQSFRMAVRLFLASLPKGHAILSLSCKSMGKNVSLCEYFEGGVLPLAFPFASSLILLSTATHSIPTTVPSHRLNLQKMKNNGVFVRQACIFCVFKRQVRGVELPYSRG